MIHKLICNLQKFEAKRISFFSLVFPLFAESFLYDNFGKLSYHIKKDAAANLTQWFGDFRSQSGLKNIALLVLHYQKLFKINL